LLSLACFAISLATLADNEQDRSPPQSNPNDEQTRKHVETSSLDPIPSSDDHQSAGISMDESCDLKSISEASSDTVTKLIKDSNARCMERILSLRDKSLKEICNESKMKSVADAFSEVVSKYQPTPEINNYVLYLRSCFYASFHRNTGKFSDEILSKVRSGIEAFLKQPKIETENDDHYKVTHNIVHLISNSHDDLHFVEQLSQVLAKLSDTWKFKPQSKYHKIDQTDVVNAMFFVFFMSHKNVTESTKYYCDHSEVPQILNDFMDKHSDLVNTTNEYILRNAGGELARFLKYKCLQEKVDGFVEKQLKQYNAKSAHKVWMTLVVIATRYGTKKYGGKNMRINTSMESSIITFKYDCGKSYKDSFIIKAQNTMTTSEASQICQKLKSHESFFHNLVKDSWQPVADDFNEKLEVIIFNNDRDYKYYGNLIYSIPTNNGGYYLEGHPNVKTNQARYYCYKMNRNGQSVIWNLEHEFTHYLDGRYNMKDSTFYTMGGRRFWWLEGFPEYAAYKQNHPDKVKLCKSNRYALSYIFYTTYSSGQDLIYDYGYLAARFMFEKHRSDVDTILKYFRAGQYSQFESWFNGIYNRYDSEFRSWCSCIASGGCQ